MQTLSDLFAFCMLIFLKPLSFGGFTFNLWDVFVFTIIASIIGWALGKLVNINSSI